MSEETDDSQREGGGGSQWHLRGQERGVGVYCIWLFPTLKTLFVTYRLRWLLGEKKTLKIHC